MKLKDLAQRCRNLRAALKRHQKVVNGLNQVQDLIIGDKVAEIGDELDFKKAMLADLATLYDGDEEEDEPEPEPEAEPEQAKHEETESEPAGEESDHEAEEKDPANEAKDNVKEYHAVATADTKEIR